VKLCDAIMLQAKVEEYLTVAEDPQRSVVVASRALLMRRSAVATGPIQQVT
jgi:hypothetical protein